MRIGEDAGSAWVGEPGLPPELRALVACARAVVDRRRLAEFQRALAACPDAGPLCETAVLHGMLGHLHRLVSADQASRETGGAIVAPALVRRLAGVQRLSAQRALRQAGHLLRVLDRLREAGIEAMPYKGPAWAERFYGDVTLRSWADLDVLVRYEQVPRAREVLQANGFVDGSPFNARLLARKRRGWGEVALSAFDQGVHVELHWEVGVGFSAKALEPDAIFARAGRCRLIGREVAGPSAVDCLLISCLNGTKDRWAGIEGLLGVAVQMQSLAPGTWKEVLAAARQAGCFRRVVIGAAHACSVLGVETPPEVAGALGRDVVARTLLRSLTPESLDQEASQGSRGELTNIFWRAATEDSVATGVWHGAVRFFRPGPEDWDWIVLPRRAEWLYRVLRPARLIVKWARRL